MESLGAFGLAGAVIAALLALAILMAKRVGRVRADRKHLQDQLNHKEYVREKMEAIHRGRPRNSRDAVNRLRGIKDRRSKQ